VIILTKRYELAPYFKHFCISKITRLDRAPVVGTSRQESSTFQDTNNGDLSDEEQCCPTIRSLLEDDEPCVFDD